MSKRADKKAAKARDEQPLDAAEASAGLDDVGAEESGVETAPAEDAADSPSAAAGRTEADAVDEASAPDPDADDSDALRAERDEMREKWLRTLAEMDNLRKRTRREVLESRRFAQADVLRAFLDIHDNLERALHSATNADDTEASGGIREGVELIFQKFRSVLKDQGVETIAALDATFDPNVHEAVGQIPREGVEPGLVIEVVQPGYRLGDMVLRPARVLISS